MDTIKQCSISSERLRMRKRVDDAPFVFARDAVRESVPVLEPWTGPTVEPIWDFRIAERRCVEVDKSRGWGARWERSGEAARDCRKQLGEAGSERGGRYRCAPQSSLMGAGRDHNGVEVTHEGLLPLLLAFEVRIPASERR